MSHIVRWGSRLGVSFHSVGEELICNHDDLLLPKREKEMNVFLPIASVVSALQSLFSSKWLVDLFSIVSWLLIPVIFVVGAYGVMKIVLLRHPKFDTGALEGTRREQFKRWEIWLKNIRGMLEVKSNFIGKIADVCTGLGFLGTTLGIICLLAKFGISGDAGQSFDISGLHTAFITTAAGIVCSLLLEVLLSVRIRGIKRTLLVRDYQLQIEVGLYEIQEYQSSGGSNDERFQRLEQMFQKLQEQIQRMEMDTRKPLNLPFTSSNPPKQGIDL